MSGSSSLKKTLVLFALALVACRSSDARSGASIEGTVPSALATTLAPPVIEPNSPTLPPWKQEAHCYWVLTYPDGVAHRAWIGANQNGVFLNIVDDSIRSWPVSDALQITLVANGTSERTVAARGNHGDEDSATLLTIILDKPQQALIAGAKDITIASEDRIGFTLPMVGVPTHAALAACDTTGPGEFSQE